MGGSLKACIKCGKQHKAASVMCRACLFADLPPRTCITCGDSFPYADSRKCWRCRQTIVPKPCLDCSQTFTGSALRCEPCRAVERLCTACGATFHDRAHRECSDCRKQVRACDDCGRTITSLNRTCSTCLVAERTCPDCDRQFNGTRTRCNACHYRNAPAYEVRLERGRAHVRRRRLMQLTQGDDGIVPRPVRARIVAEGPCVYCGDPATETDHVRPVVRGGAEHESNLVGACSYCNQSKGARLLTEWPRTERVAHGVEASAKVAAEWNRLQSLANADA